MITDIIDMATDWPMGTVLFILMVVAAALVIGLIGWFIFWAIDSWFRPEHTKEATVTDKKFVAAHTTTTYMTVNKVTTPIITHHPDAWYVAVKFVEGFGGNCQVSETFHDSVSRGDKVQGTFAVGRISKSCYVHGLSK